MHSTVANNLASPILAISLLALFIVLLVLLGPTPARAQDQYAADQYQIPLYQYQYPNQYQDQYQYPYQYQPAAPSQVAPPASNGCYSYLLNPQGYGWRCSHIYTWYD